MSPTRPDRDFRRTYWASAGMLAALCLVFLALTWFQGPKLDGVQVDATRAVAHAGQQLRFFANQAVAQVDDGQVTISPKTPFTVTVDGDVIALQFSERLRYDTEYTVDVSDVTSVYRDQKSTVSHSFTTPSAELLFLDRAEPDSGDTDSIKRLNVSTGETSVVYSSARIQEFTSLGQALVVQSLREDATNSLDLVSMFDQAVENVILPEDGTIQGLSASDSFIAFAFTSANPTEQSEYLSTLLRMDLAAKHELKAVSGLDGGPLQVIDWLFVPGASEVIALNVNDSLLRIDLSPDGVVLPLGTYERLGRISSDGSALIVSTAFDSAQLSLEDGSETTFIPSLVNGKTPFGGDAEPLSGGAARVQKVTEYDFASNTSTTHIVVDDGVSSRPVFSTSGHSGIEDFTVSPNGQYVAVEVVPFADDTVSDGYFPDARPISVVTHIIDIGTGAVLRELPGFAVSW